MQVFRSSAATNGQLAGCAVAIGNFDGVHLGHQALFRKATLVAQDGPVVALTFDPHPARFFRPDLAPPLLSSEDEKLALLEAQGLDAVVIQPFDAELASLSPSDFGQQVLATQLAAAHVIVGDNFVYGSKRAGNLETLTQQGAELGFTVHGVPAVTIDSLVASSSKIREFVHLGKLRGAAALLGRAYQVAGTVVDGAGRGTGIGVPTANLQTAAEVLPPRGVYACFARTAESDRWHSAAVNIGRAPTFESSKSGLTIEAHILDFDRNIRGQTLCLAFVERLRQEQRFESVDQLVAQIRQDIDASRALLDKEATP